MEDENFKQIKNYIYEGNIKKLKESVEKILTEGVSVKKILDEALLGGMEKVGKDFKCNKIFIPEVMLAAKTVHAGLEILEPHFEKEGIQPKGKIVIGTVNGDLHDIGKNLVSMMLRGGGYQVIDLGVDVSKEKFFKKVKDEKINIVGMSCLISTALENMRETVSYLKSKSSNLKIMIGGAVVTNKFATSIGADAYGETATEGVEIAKKLSKNTTKTEG